jgi:uncharacterized protein (DUF885 family)
MSLASNKNSEWSEDVTTVDKETVSREESIALKVNQDDMEDLVKSHNRELTTEDLQELKSFTEQWREGATPR